MKVRAKNILYIIKAFNAQCVAIHLYFQEIKRFTRVYHAKYTVMQYAVMT
jgi:hypothetical protein